MGSGMKCLKCLLVFFNVFILVIGIILLAAGIFIKAAANKFINQLASPYLAGITKMASQYSSSGTTPDATQLLDFGVLLDPIGIALIVLGLIFGGTALLGVVGGCKGSKIPLIVYAVIVSVLLLIQCALVGAFFNNQMSGPLQAQLTTTLNQYVDLSDFGVFSLAWNFVMASMNCCGLTSYLDFQSDPKWVKTMTVSQGGVTATVTLVTPIACCKLTGSFPSVQVSDPTCAVTPTDINSNWKTGCWDAVSAYLSTYRNPIVGALAGLIVFQALFVVLAIVIAVKASKDNKVEDNSPKYEGNSAEK